MNEILLDPGSPIEVSGVKYEVVSLLPSGQVRAKNLLDGEIKTFPLSQIEFSGKESKIVATPFDALSEKQKKVSEERYNILKQVLEIPHGERKATAKVLAKQHSISVRTLYYWIQLFQSTGKVSSLVDRRETRGSRRSRLSRKHLAIINRIAEEYYETPQKPSIKRAIEQIQLACREAKISIPSERTIRRHIESRNLYLATKKREGVKTAHDRFGTVYSRSHQDLDQPLSLVQMDHTILDIELVDDDNRLPIGRPALTIALDVFSRVITGVFVSFENVSLLTAGLCLEHAMFPKDDWLKKHGITNDWPIWGKPICLHVDNAMEFRSHGLEDFCREYGVRLEYRPVGKPHYGGHVERVIRTINERVHTLPGTTFSNIKQKGRYDSTKNASMTLQGFQKWLGEYITGHYLKKVHSSLGISPLEKWMQGIRGNGDRIGVGTPPILANRADVCSALLPTYERSLTREGIILDYIHYSSLELHAFRYQRENRKERSKVTVKRDPRDLSYIKVLDKDRKKWIRVPFRTDTNPSVSLWEWQAALHGTEKKKRSENEIFDNYRKMRNTAEGEVEKTKKQRRLRQRSQDAKKDVTTSKQSKPFHLLEDNTATSSKLVSTEKVKTFKNQFSLN